MPLVKGRYLSPYSAASQKPRYASEYSTAHAEADVEMRSGRYARGGIVDPRYEIDPRAIDSWERESGPLGSNPGGMYEAPDGSKYYVKSYAGANGDDRAKNEKLTNELYRLVGVPVPDVKLTEWKARTALASPIIDGEKLDRFEPRFYKHIDDLLEHYPADAWLANYDVAGTNHNNIIIDRDGNGHAHRIDAGGGLRYRAKGDLKEHFGDDVPELEQLKDTEFNKWAAKLFKGVKVGKDDPSYATARRIAQIPDDHIRTLVGIYGPEPREDNDKLANTIIARRDNVAKAYGIKA